jgi:hypothetical protein
VPVAFGMSVHASFQFNSSDLKLLCFCDLLWLPEVVNATNRWTKCVRYQTPDDAAYVMAV